MVASVTQRLILKFGAEKPVIHADMTDVASGYLRDRAVTRLRVSWADKTVGRFSA